MVRLYKEDYNIHKALKQYEHTFTTYRGTSLGQMPTLLWHGHDCANSMNLIIWEHKHNGIELLHKGNIPTSTPILFLSPFEPPPSI